MFEKEYLAIVVSGDVAELYELGMETQARNHARTLGGQVVTVVCKEKPAFPAKLVPMKLKDVL